MYFVYILTNKNNSVLYTGVTNNVLHRVQQHRESGSKTAFTSRYKAYKLVYVESTQDVLAALAREKQIKGWVRAKKVALIESLNPSWEDLVETWHWS